MSTINTILNEIDKVDRKKPSIFLIAKYSNMNWGFKYGYCDNFESYINSELQNQKQEYFDEENKIPTVLPLLLLFSNNMKMNKYILEKEIIPKLNLYCLYLKENFLIKPISESYDVFLETFEKHEGKIFQSKIHRFNHINVFSSRDIVLSLWIEKPAITIEEWEDGEEDLCGSLRVLCMSPSSDEKYFKPDVIPTEVVYSKPVINNLGKKYKINSERENYFNKKIRCAF